MTESAHRDDRLIFWLRLACQVLVLAFWAAWFASVSFAPGLRTVSIVMLGSMSAAFIALYLVDRRRMKRFESEVDARLPELLAEHVRPAKRGSTTRSRRLMALATDPLVESDPVLARLAASVVPSRRTRRITRWLSVGWVLAMFALLAFALTR